MAQLGQSKPDSGPGFQAKVLQNVEVVAYWLGRWAGEWASILSTPMIRMTIGNISVCRESQSACLERVRECGERVPECGGERMREEERVSECA